MNSELVKRKKKMGDAADDLFDAAMREQENSEMDRDTYIEVEVEFKTSTKDAILVAKEGEEVWVPRSLLSYGTDKTVGKAARGSGITISVRGWFAAQKGLI
jgi:hypothetical protein